nr:MAG TPA: hypothetical protein [Bacteriophage sp.]
MNLIFTNHKADLISVFFSAIKKLEKILKRY